MTVLFSLAFEYPWTHFQLDATRTEHVRAEFESLAGRYDLFENQAAWSRILEVFTCQCAPLDPSRAQLGVACHFLYMTLYLNEARSGGLSRELLRDYLRVLRGGSPARAHSLLRAAAEFRPKLLSHLQGSHSDSSAFFHYTMLALGAFEHESERQSPPSLVSYAATRLHSISALGYLQLWKLLLGVELEAELGSAAHLFCCEQLSARIQGLANDMASLPRDQRESTPNWVLQLAQTEQIDLPAALERASRQHELWVAEYVSAAEAARSTSHDARVLTYLEFIGSCTAGNLISMRELTARYR